MNVFIGAAEAAADNAVELWVIDDHQLASVTYLPALGRVPKAERADFTDKRYPGIEFGSDQIRHTEARGAIARVSRDYRAAILTYLAGSLLRDASHTEQAAATEVGGAENVYSRHLRTCYRRLWRAARARRWRAPVPRSAASPRGHDPRRTAEAHRGRFPHQAHWTWPMPAEHASRRAHPSRPRRRRLQPSAATGAYGRSLTTFAHRPARSRQGSKVGPSRPHDFNRSTLPPRKSVPAAPPVANDCGT